MHVKVLYVYKITDLQRSMAADQTVYTELRSRAERVLLVVDISQELGYAGLGRAQRWEAVSELLALFVEQKLGFDAEHEVGLALLTQGEVTLLCDFTSNKSTVLGALGMVQPVDTTEGYDFSMLVEFIAKLQKDKHLFKSESSFEIDKVFRMILVYSRCSEVPYFSGETTEAIRENDTAFSDVVFVHGAGTGEGRAEKAQEILAWLVESFESHKLHKTCYVVEASSNYERFVQQFLLLLA